MTTDTDTILAAIAAMRARADQLAAHAEAQAAGVAELRAHVEGMDAEFDRLCARDARLAALCREAGSLALSITPMADTGTWNRLREMGEYLSAAAAELAGPGGDA